MIAELDKANPVLLVGASTDHRLGSAAVRAGARDYFALPGDLDALRRTLEREGRERRGASEGGRLRGGGAGGERICGDRRQQ